MLQISQSLQSNSIKYIYAMWWYRLVQQPKKLFKHNYVYEWAWEKMLSVWKHWIYEYSLYLVYFIVSFLFFFILILYSIKMCLKNMQEALQIPKREVPNLHVGFFDCMFWCVQYTNGNVEWMTKLNGTNVILLCQNIVSIKWNYFLLLLLCGRCTLSLGLLFIITPESQGFMK